MGIIPAITAAWTAIGALGQAIVVGAVVGAAIGGISAAITGGSIGQGMLFGAIGGAVTGGLGSALTGGTFGAASGAMKVGTDVGTQAASSAGRTTLIGVGREASTKATTAALLSEAGKEVLAQGVAAGIGGYMNSEINKDNIAAASDAAALAHDRNKETMRLAAELAEEASGTAQAVDNTAAELAYDARMAELSQRKSEFDTSTEQTRTEWDTEMTRRAQRRSLFSTSSSGDTDATLATDNDQVDMMTGTSLLEKRQDNVKVNTVDPEGALAGAATEEI